MIGKVHMIGKQIKTVSLVCVFLIGCVSAYAETVLVEAERFTAYGGWVLDQQFMDQMGSPYLLAHGLGKPVADAETMVTFPITGTYRVWVRTRDWVGPWKTLETPESKLAVGAPGQFQLVLDGVALETVFGTDEANWHWQDGGSVEIAEPNVSLALHDLTGFEGRCDAILFSTDADMVPPNADPNMATWRRTLLGLSQGPVEAGDYDLVVIGGGMAGTCAAVRGARMGLSVALIQDRPVLGGNNSSEVRVHLLGNTNYDRFPQLGDVVRELDPGYSGNRQPAYQYGDEKKLAVVQAEDNIDLYLNHRGNEVEMDANSILAVIAQNTQTGQRLRFAAPLFADCTGDGCIGYLAGADYEMTLDGHMGRSNLWRIAEVSSGRNSTVDTSFPPSFWALNLYDKSFPTSDLGNWFWESGFYRDPIEDGEYIRDWNFRAMYGAWDALKNDRGQYDDSVIEWQAYISGKRESRRLLGDVVLTHEDMGAVSGVPATIYPDGCVGVQRDIDLHYPNTQYNKGFEGDAFISRAQYTDYDAPYFLPYRCLYSRNIDNLFMAGRCLSVTHEALGAPRVMKTCGMMGEVVGVAASLCKTHDSTPRGLYTDHLDELMAALSYIPPTPPPAWLEDSGPNYALTATVDVSSTYNSTYVKENLNDGVADTSDNTGRWLSSGSSMPDVVTFTWTEPVTISAARIVSGWNNGSSVDSQILDFHFEYDSGTDWQTIEDSAVISNTKTDRPYTFSAVESDRIRLVITQTPSDISRIWEVELYHPDPNSQ